MAAVAAARSASSYNSAPMRIHASPESVCEQHLPQKVIEVLMPFLGANLRNWKIGLDDVRCSTYNLNPQDGVQVILSSDGELDVYVSKTRSDGASTARFSFKNRLPTTHINVLPSNRQSDAEKVDTALGFLRERLAELNPRR